MRMELNNMCKDFDVRLYNSLVLPVQDKHNRTEMAVWFVQTERQRFLPAPIPEMEFPKICRYHRADPKVLVWPGKLLELRVGIPLGLCGSAGPPVTDALGRTAQSQETELSLGR